MSVSSSHDHGPSVPAYKSENPYAGQGPVMLEIGVDSGALVVSAPEALTGREIEIRRFGRTQVPLTDLVADHVDGARVHSPHVAVIPRPLPNGATATCAVFPDLEPGVYTLWLMPSGPSMPVHVGAGEVTTADWIPRVTMG